MYRTEQGNTRYMTHARTSFCKVLQVQGLSLGTICRRVAGSSGRHIFKSKKCLSTPPFGVDNTEIAPSLPRPCCRTTFLASTVVDGKSELLKKKQRRARAMWHHGGPPPPPWQQPACCLCVHCLAHWGGWGWDQNQLPPGQRWAYVPCWHPCHARCGGRGWDWDQHQLPQGQPNSANNQGALN